MSVLDTFRLDGRVALVTGGAGLYGRQIVEALAEAGATVVMTSRNAGQPTAQFQDLLQEWSARGLVVHAKEFDQERESSVTALCKQLEEEFGGVDILVNNAVLRPMGDWNSRAEDFAKSMAVNATGLWMITKAVGDRMAARGGGSILNIGSIQGMIGPDFNLYEDLGWGIPPDYFFHKGGMLQLTRYAAAKLGPAGVRVNTISPGGLLNSQDERFLQRYCRHTFLGRMANNTDLKGIVVFLASDASAYITGANIPVDGGYTAQ